MFQIHLIHRFESITTSPLSGNVWSRKTVDYKSVRVPFGGVSDHPTYTITKLFYFPLFISLFIYIISILQVRSTRV